MPPLDAAALEARYQLTDEDNKAFQTLAKGVNSGVAPKLQLLMFGALILFALGTSFYGTVVAKVKPRPAPNLAGSSWMGSPWASVLGMLIPIVVVGVFWLVIVRVGKAEQSKSTAFVEESIMRLDRVSATNICGPYTNITQWHGLVCVASSETHIAFLTNVNSGYIVPRRAFNDDQSWQRFVDFAREQWQQSQPTVPPIAAA